VWDVVLGQQTHLLALSPQRCVPQDTGFSSLFLKVLMQLLQWLESPAVEAGPLQAQLKHFATQYSARHRISDGEGAGAWQCQGSRQCAGVSDWGQAGWGPRSSEGRSLT
jgi:hypothetical protein